MPSLLLSMGTAAILIPSLEPTRVWPGVPPRPRDSPLNPTGCSRVLELAVFSSFKDSGMLHRRQRRTSGAHARARAPSASGPAPADADASSGSAPASCAGRGAPSAAAGRPRRLVGRAANINQEICTLFFIIYRY